MTSPTPTLLRDLVATVRPHEIYNVASTSTLAAAWADPVRCARDTGLPVAVLLQAILAVDPSIRLVQASSSQIFGAPAESPQSERTPPSPADPYAAAKLYADSMVAVHRQRHGLHASSAILFNHESPRRPPAYVSRKVTRAVAAMARGATEPLVLGDLAAVRDWSLRGRRRRGHVAHGPGRRAGRRRPRQRASGARSVSSSRSRSRPPAWTPRGAWRWTPASCAALTAYPWSATPRWRASGSGWSARTSFEEMIGAMVAHDVAELDAQAAAGLRSRM